MDSRPHMLVASFELANVLVARDRRYDYPGSQIGLFAKLKLMNCIMRARQGKPCWVYCCPLIWTVRSHRVLQRLHGFRVLNSPQKPCSLFLACIFRPPAIRSYEFLLGRHRGPKGEARDFPPFRLCARSGLLIVLGTSEAYVN